jgi:nitrogen-specific signal transduction histidine kinase/CheY-like chemotaxis protein
MPRKPPSDVSPSRRHDLELRLQQAQRMEAIGRMAGGIAHDLNNLLTVIRGYADLAILELGDTDLSRDLEEVRKASDRAVDLTRQLLAFSRRQAPAPSQLDINALLSDSARLLRRLLGETIVLDCAFSDDLWPARADRGQVEQVVMNLAVNARDAMSEGGRLSIVTSNATLDAAHARHLGVAAGDYVSIAVRDTGEGMTSEVVTRLFEPFFTTKAIEDGAGLGLATVRGIVTLHRGAVDVVSVPGKGSTFTVLLPRDRHDEADVPGGHAIVPRPSADGATILLVEDEAAVRALASTILAKAGFTVVEAANATEALSRAAAREGPIDLLLSDVVLPGSSGPSLAATLHETRPDTRVVFMSGYAGDAWHHAHLGGAALLPKPFSAAGLVAAVDRALAAPRTP